jgi:hypothetical protein
VSFCRLYYQIKAHYKNVFNIKKLDDYDKMLKLIRPGSTIDKYWQRKSLEEQNAIKAAYLNNFKNLKKDKNEEVGNKYFLLEGMHPAFSEFAIEMLMPPVLSDGLENKLNTQPDYELMGRSSVYFGENAIYKALGRQEKTKFRMENIEKKN